MKEFKELSIEKRYYQNYKPYAKEHAIQDDDSLTDVEVIGKLTEEAIVQELYNLGYWTHLIASTNGGQPFDIIASRNQKTWFFDVKSIQSAKRFNFQRVEANQITAFRLLEACGTDTCGFILVFKKYQVVKFAKFSDFDFEQETSVAYDDERLTNLYEVLR